LRADEGADAVKLGARLARERVRRGVLTREKLERGLTEAFGGGEEARMRAHFVGHLIGLDFSQSQHLAGILGDVSACRGAHITSTMAVSLLS
jgi:hypothetical protein